MRNRPDEALRQAALGLEFDPLSVYTNFSFAYSLMFAGEYDRARAQAVSTLEAFPDCLHAWYVVGWAELGRGCHAAAVVAFEKAVALSPDIFSLAYLAHALGRAGQTTEARAILEKLVARRASEYVAEFVYVVVYSGLGERDAAFTALEKCYAERDSRLFWLQVVPCFDPLRGDPRFDDLARRLGLPAAPTSKCPPQKKGRRARR
jgi:tetratricopeptide (TPR) repeat protein